MHWDLSHIDMSSATIGIGSDVALPLKPQMTCYGATNRIGKKPKGAISMVMQAKAELRALREMAAKGRDRSTGGGEFLLTWGFAVAIGSALDIMLPPACPSIVPWGGAIGSGFIVTLAEIFLLRRSIYGVTWRTEVLATTWLVSAGAIVVFNLGEDIARGGLPSESEAATAMILGVALAATSTITHAKSLIVPASIWIGLGFFLLVASPGINIPLILAVAALLLLVLPGVLLLFRSRRAPDHRPE